MDRFAQVLYDLGKVIHVDLSPDKKRICRLNVEGRLHIQIECEEAKERLLLATFVGEVPAGKFRENALKEALKNNSQYPRIGTFAYVERNNQLALQQYVPLEGLTGEKFASILTPFIEMANHWVLALQKGTVPTIDVSTRGGSSMFGLR